jgi:TIR domain
MFGDQIQHLKDMIRRLERLNGSLFKDADQFPEHQRITEREWDEWQESLTSKIQSECSPYIVSRFKSIRRQFHDDIDDQFRLKRQRGDNFDSTFDVTAEITFLKRTVSLLSDLDERSSDYSPILTISSPHMPTEAGHDAFLDNVTLHTWDLFISYAHEDKEAIARPLYKALTKKNISVWFDEVALDLGTNLNQEINKGLATCRFGIVILSPFYLQKQWPRLELEGLLARETNLGKTFLIPIWHNINAKDLVKHSPILAGKVAGKSKDGIRKLVKRIIKVIIQ